MSYGSLTNALKILKTIKLFIELKLNLTQVSYTSFYSECAELIVNVLEAKDLIDPNKEENLMDSFVTVFLTPDKLNTIQTRICRNTNSPSYKERFLFCLNQGEQTQRSLHFHVYCIDKYSYTLVGEGELRLNDISLKQPVTTWITLTDTGEVIFFFELPL